MADYEDGIFSNLPRRRRRTDADGDNTRSFFREALGMYVPEGPLPPRPHASGKGGPSINQGAAPPPVTSVWSAADAAANAMTLSNGGLTLSVPTGSAAWRMARNSINKTSGKLYIEVNTSTGSADTFHIGLASPGVNIGSYLGDSNYSFGESPIYGTIFVSSGFAAGGSPGAMAINANDTFALAVDFTTGKVWIGQNGVFAGDPVAETAPVATFTPATVGALFFAMAFNTASGATSKAVTTWTLQSTPATQKYLPPPGFQAWDGGPVTPPPSSVWSAADAAANGMTLTNGGLTAAAGSCPLSTVRSTNAQTSGKYYIEFLCLGSSGFNSFGFGLASSGFNVSSFLSSTNYSCMAWCNGGGPYVSTGFASSTTAPVYSPVLNDVFQMAVDLSAGKAWFGLNNVWYASGAPASGTAPLITIVSPALGLPLYPGISNNSGSATGPWALQSTAASQKYAPPAGFSAWDGGAAPPPTSVWSAADAAAGSMTLSNGGLTVTPSGAGSWQSVRSSISQSSGKLYIEFFNSAVPNWGTGNLMLGVGSSAINISNYLGASNYSFGYMPAGPLPFVSMGANGAYHYVSGGPNPSQNDVWAIAIDLTAGNIWLAQNNVWANGSNPATGTLPIVTYTPAQVAAMFAGLSFNGPGCGVWTLQATAASQKYAPPSGFTPWG